MVKKYKRNSICIKIYLEPNLFAEVVHHAEESGIRRRGLQLYTQKAHGLIGEQLANTDKVAKYLKYTHEYYVKHEAERLEQKRLAQIELDEIKKKAKLLGLEG